MFEIDKHKFGAFVSQLRKEKGLTQKDLAQKLYISDKAISKWETGVSIPDVALLIPLSEALGVTVTELLQCRRMENPQPMDQEQVEDLVKAAIAYSEEEPKLPRITLWKRIGLLFACFMAAAAGTALVFYLGLDVEQTYGNLMVFEIMFTIFGAYFLIFAQEKLPKYYDENKIQVYSDGFFKMNIPGVYFNNRNWPHIRNTGAICCLVILVCFPFVFYLAERLIPASQIWAKLTVLLGFTLGGLFVPIVVAAKKHQ